MKSKTVLILDDDAGVARLVSSAVRAAGGSPVSFGRGDEALAWMSQNKADLLLLDNVLPDMNASEFLDKAERAGDSVPFIITTGQGSETVAVDMMKRGAMDYVVKDSEFLQALPVVMQRSLDLIKAQRRLKDVESSLAQFRVETRAILEAAADGIVTFDADGRIVTANAALGEMYGMTEPPIGQDVSRLFSQADGGSMPIYPSRASTNEVKRRLRSPREFVAVKSGGVTFDAEVTFSEVEGSHSRLYLAIIRDISDKKRVQRQMLHDALHDKLTGLPNRTHAVSSISQAMSRNMESSDASCAVLFIDLDRFKVVNDSLGHAAGDLLLMEVARRLAHVVHNQDTLARIASDEFAIVIPQVSDVRDATLLAQRVLDALDPEVSVRGATLKAGASIGIALSQKEDADAEDLLRRADLAMNRAKQNGRGRYEVFEAEMHSRTALMMRLEIDLRRAIGTDQIVNYYQPVIDLQKGRVAGFEALVRWKPPGKAMVSPADFIPLAEETGLISSLGRQVLRNACRQNRLWRDKLGIPVVISVNLSARQLRSDDVVTMVAQALKESDLPPGAMKLELTESAFMDYNRGVLGALDELKRMGVGMSIDDFGTGYSSFAYLGKMPIETIKMDKSFIEGLPGQADHIAISSAILAMAQAMKVNVVAEGVEHSGQLNFLRQHGCRWVQGFLFSRPVDAQAAEVLLGKSLVIPD